MFKPTVTVLQCNPPSELRWIYTLWSEFIFSDTHYFVLTPVNASDDNNNTVYTGTGTSKEDLKR